MKIFSKVVIDIKSGRVIDSDIIDENYQGPIAKCDGGGGGGGGGGGDYGAYAYSGRTGDPGSPGSDASAYGGYTSVNQTAPGNVDYSTGMPVVTSPAMTTTEAEAQGGLYGGYDTPTDEVNAAGKKNLEAGIQGLLEGGLLGGLKGYVESALAQDLSPEAAAIVAAEFDKSHESGFGSYSSTGYRPSIQTQRGTMTPVKGQEGSAGKKTGPEGEVEEVKRQREAARKRRGLTSTLMTGPLGLVERPSVERKTLFALG